MKVWIYVETSRFFVPAELLGWLDVDGHRRYFYRVTRTVGAWREGAVEYARARNVCSRPRRWGLFGSRADLAVIPPDLPRFDPKPGEPWAHLVKAEKAAENSK